MSDETTGNRPRSVAEIDATRVASGVCRHCSGPVPCHSWFGDQRVGVRHSDRSFKAMQKREQSS